MEARPITPDVFILRDEDARAVLVCGREFERSTHDATLRPHKNRMKMDCYGTTGIYVRTKY